jgi:small-conductance mechanosensitive channel
LPPTPRQAATAALSALDRLPVRELATGVVVVGLAWLCSRGVSLLVSRSLTRLSVGGAVDPASRTRLLMSRRLINAVIWLLALAAVLGQFPHLRVLSAGLIASAGVGGIVVGFAARSTLGNAVAGVTIAFAQPFRIGDDIEFRGERGIVEDITLTFTILRLGDGKRLVIPNDVLSSEVTRNLTLGQASRVARVEVLVAPRADVAGVRKAMLSEALAFAALDAKTAAPEVYFARIDERGTLLRLVAPCSDAAAAEQLAQRVLGRSAELAFRPHTPLLGD